MKLTNKSQDFEIGERGPMKAQFLYTSYPMVLKFISECGPILRIY